MAPKKKGAKKGASDPAKLLDRESLKRAETEIVCLQRQLELRSHEALEARRSERIWREKSAAFGEALDKQKEDTLDITSDMMRKYKLLRDQSQHLITDLEDQKRELLERMARETERADVAEARCVEREAQLDAQITLLKKQMSGMQLEFADMLKLTIDKMHEKLEQAYAAGA